MPRSCVHGSRRLEVGECLVILWSVLLSGMLLSAMVIVAPCEAADSAKAAQAEKDATSRRSAEGAESWRAMSERVDVVLRERAEAEQVATAPPASDAAFFRRVSLDLTGRIPAVSEVREWLADSGPNRRTRVIEQLLHSPRHTSHLANTWRRFLLPGETDPRLLTRQYGLERWLRIQFADNRPYDAAVRELLLGTDDPAGNPEALYYTAFEVKPQTLAANVARSFLGIQIQCAECHDHPFDHWTRQDFWGMAAFFARLQPPGRPGGVAFNMAGRLEESGAGEITLPGSDEVVPPRFLGSEQPVDADAGRRVQLAEWLTSSDNPYFARAAVNRVWGHLFGRGLVDPVDDLGSHNPGSHPQLLDELAEFFVQSGFDVRMLLRVLANTEAYQLASHGEGDAGARTTLFRQMAIKSLTAEQLYDCLQTALAAPTGQTSGGAYQSQAFSAGRRAFLARFADASEDRTEFRAGIPQALTLMNGTLIGQGTDLEQGPMLRSLEAPFLDDSQRVEILFLATLSRPPRPDESEQFLAYVTGAESPTEQRRALADVLWALLNSAEFSLNH